LGIAVFRLAALMDRTCEFAAWRAPCGTGGSATGLSAADACWQCRARWCAIL